MFKSKVKPLEWKASSSTNEVLHKSRVFPSTRFFMAVILCFCFISLSVATSNLSQAMVCVVYAAQNAGSLFMLLAGWQADRLNGKWTIAVALILLIISNSLIPVLASYSPWLVAFFRVMTGIGDALIFPSASSMITRWFPPKERPFAIGFVTGGRQIGTLLILPIGGIFCEHPMDLGWRAIFYLSAIFGAIILIIWLLFSADKPSKHFCVSKREEGYITRKIGDEKIGKRSDRGSPPWNKFVRCLPLYVAVAAILLPKYFADVLELSNAANGLISSLPSVVLLISKTISCIVASLITTRKPPLLGSTACCKFFNFIASLGLAVCVGLVPLIGSKGNPVPVILVLCLANAFAGMHTPGVQTALVQLAPAYSGIVTGIAFSFSAVFSIINKMISSSILLIIIFSIICFEECIIKQNCCRSGTSKEWAVVFEISAVVAFLPVVFFTVWGSADVQPWAKNSSNNLEQNAKRPSTISQSDDNVVKALALYSLFLAYNFGAT
ncbi:transporter, major facilitator family protein [Dictyocaulus viviparus]|uniref:Transporter, major facilitator family protein n=1 Tax=Dictyocaulus viviparus TaxID=29172 RepID=A0A0D8XE23_DICVI|nr:transporter, major facilitator family protein [Dictyocaulus viviparus]